MRINLSPNLTTDEARLIVNRVRERLGLGSNAVQLDERWGQFVVNRKLWLNKKRAAIKALDNPEGYNQYKQGPGGKLRRLKKEADFRTKQAKAATVHAQVVGGHEAHFVAQQKHEDAAKVHGQVVFLATNLQHFDDAAKYKASQRSHLLSAQEHKDKSESPRSNALGYFHHRGRPGFKGGSPPGAKALKATDYANHQSLFAHMTGKVADHLTAHKAHAKATTRHEEAFLSAKKAGNSELANYHKSQMDYHVRMQEHHSGVYRTQPALTKVNALKILARVKALAHFGHKGRPGQRGGSLKGTLYDKWQKQHGKLGGLNKTDAAAQSKHQQALLESVGSFAKQHGYGFKPTTDNIAGTHMALHVPGSAGIPPVLVVFKFQSPSEAARTLKDYHHPWPVIQSIQNPDRSKLYVSPKTSQDIRGTRKVRDTQTLDKRLPEIIKHAQEARYIHSGD